MLPYVILPEKLGGRGTQLENPGGDGLALHQGWRVDQLVLLQIPERKQNCKIQQWKPMDTIFDERCSRNLAPTCT